MPSMVAAAHSGGSAFPLLLPLLMLVLIGMMLFGQRRRAASTARSQAALVVGDEVRTTSGLYGTLRSLDGDSGEIEIAPGVLVRFDRRALLPAPDDGSRAHATSVETPAAGGEPVEPQAHGVGDAVNDHEAIR